MIVDLDDYYLIGEIKAVFDEDGFVNIESFSDFYDRFIELDFVYLKIYGVIKKLYVDEVNFLDKNVLIQFRNFNSAESAKALVGHKIYVDEQNVVKLDENEFYIHDLLGCKLFFNDELQGSIKDVYVLETNDVYVIEKLNGEEILIPGIDDYIGDVNITKMKISLKHDLDRVFLDED